MFKVLKKNSKDDTMTKLNYSDFITQEVLTQGFSISLKGRGFSMYPFVRTGDKLFIQPVKMDELNIGDIVFYRRAQNFFIAHRLIKKIDQMTMLTKGDNRSDYDEPVSADIVLGRVVSINRNGKTINLESWSNKIVSRYCALLSPLSRWLRPVIKPAWKIYKKLCTRD